MNKTQRFVVMGVSGCGKSAIASRLADRLGIEFIEGDAYHSASNIAKMAEGVPLTDADRRDWLLTLSEIIGQAAREKKAIVLTCSSLKRKYRDLLRGGDPRLMFVHLHGDRDLIAARMTARRGHFMPMQLLDSQLADLEPPQPDEQFMQLDIRFSPDEIVDQILQRLAADA